MAATDRFGQMQYIWCLRSLFSEYTVPTVRAAGSDGGTIVVMISKALKIVSRTSYYLQQYRKCYGVWVE